MVDYVEDPFGRIVNVHWKDDDGSPPDPGGGPVYQYCGSLSYGRMIDGDGANVPMNDDPFMVHDPSSPWYNYVPPWEHRIFLHENYAFAPGIYFRGPYNPPPTILIVSGMNYRVDITRIKYDISAYPGGDPRAKVYFGVVHSHGPPDPLTRQDTFPLRPLVEFTESYSFNYNAAGQIGPDGKNKVYTWKASESGEGSSYDPNRDPTRFDPTYGGALEIVTMLNHSSYRGWGRTFGGFMGGMMEGQVIGFADAFELAGEFFTVTVTCLCDNSIPGAIHKPAVRWHDGDPSPGPLFPERLRPRVKLPDRRLIRQR